jgi:hypothetical protein
VPTGENMNKGALRRSFYEAAGYTVESLNLAKATLDKAITRIVGDMFGPEAEIIRPRIKSDERATDKWLYEKGGQIEKVTDVVAACALLPDIFSIRKAIEHFGKAGNTFARTDAGRIRIEKANDAFTDASYAKSQREHLKLKLVVSVPFIDENKNINSLKCEIQFRSAQTEAAYRASHKEYEALRPLQERMEICGKETQEWRRLEKEARPIEARIRAIHREANERAGLYALRSPAKVTAEPLPEYSVA